MKTLSLSKHRPQEQLPHANIIWIEGQQNYCVLHLAEGKPIVLTKTLKNLEQVLADNTFVRIHKEHIINRTFIASFSDTLVVLNDGTSLGLARRRKRLILKNNSTVVLI
ncbi:LytR/AlgR family response regulator transcription factor [Emticicia sp. SJ17W-69]|uniref:LytR/AlgR family response regulator transcription factor n=1 Tax=Emticicia sp. SJ17W-69 TaxID=3421657 RepID=UPI003EBBCDF7